jgi:hypothetical protein
MSGGRRVSEQKDVARKGNGRPIVLPVRGPNQLVSTEQPDASEAATSQPPEYEFLQVTGEFKPVDVASRRLIRSHVMRNYFQEKNKKSNSQSSASSAETVQAKDKLKGRWRLGSASQAEGGEPSTPRRRSKGNAVLSRRNSEQCPSRDSRKNSDTIDPALLNNQLITRDDFTPLASTPSLELFQTYRLDPFDTLPVQGRDGGDGLNRVLHFCELNNIVVQDKIWQAVISRLAI